MSLRKLCVLCASAVKGNENAGKTAEAQRTQRLRRVYLAGLNGDLFRAVQSLAKRSLLFTSLDELVRLDDGPRLIRVFNAREVAEPWLLAHRIHISLLAIQAVNYIQRTLEVRPREPSGPIHLSVNRPAEQRAIDPCQRRSVTLHTDEQHVNVTVKPVNVIVDHEFQVVGIRHEQRLLTAEAHQIRGLRADVQISMLSEKRHSVDAATLDLN